MKQYTNTARTQLTKATRKYMQGSNEHEFSLKSDLNVDLLGHYIKQRAPEVDIYLKLGVVNKNPILVIKI